VHSWCGSLFADVNIGCSDWCYVTTSDTRIAVITCMHAVSTYCSWWHLSVCQPISTKFRKLLTGNWCNLVGICPIVNARNVWKLATFDLEIYFRTFSIQAIYFERLDLAVWRYIFRISRSQFTFKVMCPWWRSWRRKSGSIHLKKLLARNCRGLSGISVTITLEVLQSFWHFNLDL